MSENKYVGMTINEKLFVSGLLAGFDLALKEKNVHQLTKILKKVELDEISIDDILKHFNLSR